MVKPFAKRGKDLKINKLHCFKAYDIRGKLGSEFNEDIAFKIGYAATIRLKAKKVVVGYDARESSTNLFNAVAQGICFAGGEVLSLGLAGTEEVYSAVTFFASDAGIAITASHNPIDYNGMKIVKSGPRPLSENEFSDIKSIAEKYDKKNFQSNLRIVDKQYEARSYFIKKIVSFVDVSKLKPLKILVNSGNGAAGPTFDMLDKFLRDHGVQTNFIRMHHNPDPNFPNGIPNPLLIGNRKITADAVIKENADFGVAFDGDFDRCFLFDHLGYYIPSEYIVGILAESFLQKHPGSTIVHDSRVTWNTLDIVDKLGGKAHTSKTGHTYLKLAMRKTDAIYGGEISAHHYFRDFSYSDSGMIPLLLIWELLSKKDEKLSNLICTRRNLFPSSGELNFSVSNPEKCIKIVKKYFSKGALRVDQIDGISVSFEAWRFNIRASNTEPLVRLNVESRGDVELLQNKIRKLSELISRQ